VTWVEAHERLDKAARVPSDASIAALRRLDPEHVDSQPHGLTLP
jgi:hypothetical protein